MSSENLAAELALIAKELSGLVDSLITRSSGPADLRRFFDADDVAPIAHAATAWVDDPILRIELGVVFGLFIWALQLDYRWMAEKSEVRPIDIMAAAHESASLGLTRLSRRNGIAVLQLQLDRANGLAWAWTERFDLRSAHLPKDWAAQQQASCIYLMGCYAATAAVLSGREENASLVAKAFEAYIGLGMLKTGDEPFLTSFAPSVASDSGSATLSGDGASEWMMRSSAILYETLAAVPVAEIFESRFRPRADMAMPGGA